MLGLIFCPSLSHRGTIELRDNVVNNFFFILSMTNKLRGPALKRQRRRLLITKTCLMMIVQTIFLSVLSQYDNTEAFPIPERLFVVASSRSNYAPNFRNGSSWLDVMLRHSPFLTMTNRGDDRPSTNGDDGASSIRIDDVTKMSAPLQSIDHNRQLSDAGEYRGNTRSNSRSGGSSIKWRQQGNGDGNQSGDDEVPYYPDGLHDIDCSRFEGWEDVPVECLEGTFSPTVSPTMAVDFVVPDQTGTGAPVETSSPSDESIEFDDPVGSGPANETMETPVSSPVTQPTSQAESSSDDAPSSSEFPNETKPSNVISLQFSMAVVHLHYLTNDERNLIVTMCLRATTDTLNNYTTLIVHDEMDPPSSSNNTINDDNRGLLGSRNSDSSIITTTDPLNVNNKGRSLDEKDDNIPRPATYLFLDDAHIIKSDYMEEWFVVTATYRAFRYDDQPIVNATRLDVIATVCDEVMTIAMNEGVFWTALESLQFGQDLLIQGTPYHSPDDAGLADCRPVGSEYDLVPFEMVDNVTPDDATHDTVLGNCAADVTWTIREWVGLGMMSVTILFGFVLSLIAVRLEKRRTREQLWGVLTEEGVGELLHVGWRYHQGTASDDNPTGTGPQLFLQIFDKGKLGYSDDNSMLQGGVEQHGVGLQHDEHRDEHGLHPITSTTAATSTPHTSTVPPPH